MKPPARKRRWAAIPIRSIMTADATLQERALPALIDDPAAPPPVTVKAGP